MSINLLSEMFDLFSTFSNSSVQGIWITSLSTDTHYPLIITPHKTNIFCNSILTSSVTTTPKASAAKNPENNVLRLTPAAKCDAVDGLALMSAVFKMRQRAKYIQGFFHMKI